MNSFHAREAIEKLRATAKAYSDSAWLKDLDDIEKSIDEGNYGRAADISRNYENELAGALTYWCERMRSKCEQRREQLAEVDFMYL